MIGKLVHDKSRKNILTIDTTKSVKYHQFLSFKQFDNSTTNSLLTNHCEFLNVNEEKGGNILFLREERRIGVSFERSSIISITGEETGRHPLVPATVWFEV